VIQISHLSPIARTSSGTNWRRACETVKRLSPDRPRHREQATAASTVLSDCRSGVRRPALRGWTRRVHDIPGNHDVGDRAAGQEADRLIDAHSLGAGGRCSDADRLAFELGGWRVVGINGSSRSGLPQEREQDAWLDAALGTGMRSRRWPSQAAVLHIAERPER